MVPLSPVPAHKFRPEEGEATCLMQSPLHAQLGRYLDSRPSFFLLLFPPTRFQGPLWLPHVLREAATLPPLELLAHNGCDQVSNVEAMPAPAVTKGTISRCRLALVGLASPAVGRNVWTIS